MVSNVTFIDTYSQLNWIAGEISWTEPSDLTLVTRYRVFAATDTELTSPTTMYDTAGFDLGISYIPVGTNFLDIYQVDYTHGGINREWFIVVPYNGSYQGNLITAGFLLIVDNPGRVPGLTISDVVFYDTDLTDTFGGFSKDYVEYFL